MNLMPIEPNPRSCTPKDHINDLTKKLRYLLMEYEAVLDKEEIKAILYKFQVRKIQNVS